MALKALDQRIATSSGERSSTPSNDTDPRTAALQAAEARAQKPVGFYFKEKAQMIPLELTL
jgi:hypothetical protein